MPKVKYRFGELETDETIPPVDAIADQIESNGLFGATGNQRGVQLRSSGVEYVTGDDFVFMRFVKEVSQEQQQIQSGEVVFGENQIARIMRFLLTRDGDYVYESTQGVYDDDAVDYLIGEDSFEIGFRTNTYSQFSEEQMRRFYTDAFRVRGLKIKDVGGADEDDVSVEPEIKDQVDRAGENLERGEFSTGQHDNDLKAPEIVDGFARLSQLDYIRAKDDEGQIQEINRNGRYVHSYPADLDLMSQAERARELLTTLTSDMIHDED